VRLGTKNFTEEFVLGQLYAQALRAKGFRVELKNDIGSSEIVDRALTAGAIDIYPEYTGVIVQEIAHEKKRPRSAADTYARAKSFQAGRGFAVLDRTPGQDVLANAVRPEFARKHGLKTTADLRRIGDAAGLQARQPALRPAPDRGPLPRARAAQGRHDRRLHHRARAA
jgi:osmoprotectant transport system substrate-binding protein